MASRRVPKTGENHDIYKWLGPIARDLRTNKGASIVIAGEQQPPIVHALAAIMNEKLGNVGKTVFHTDLAEASSVDQLASLLDLVKDLDAGAVDLLLILGGNPAFTAPVELGMGDRLKKAKLRIRLGLYADETSAGLPVAGPGNALPGNLGRCARFDGTVTIQQPLIAAALRRTLGDAGAAIVHRAARRNILTTIVKSYWSSQHTGADFEAWWRTRRPRRHQCPTRRCRSKTVTGTRRSLTGARRSSKTRGKLEVIFRPDPTIYDGRFANNGWLQELPKPITKLTWDNAAFLSPATAHRFGVQTGDMLKLTYDGRIAQRAGVHSARSRESAPLHAPPRLRPRARRTRRHMEWASTPTACAPPKRSGRMSVWTP